MRIPLKSYPALTLDCRKREGEEGSAFRAEKWMSLWTPATLQASAITLAPSTCTSWYLKFLEKGDICQ